MTILNLMKMVECSLKSRKPCGRGRNCSLRAISSFSQGIFLKDLYCKNQGLFGKGLIGCRKF